MKVSFLIFLLIVCNISNAQVIELSGIIMIGQSEVIKYQVNYEIKKNNTISGYSISDVNGSSETRASISGKYLPQKGLLQFEENKIISSKTRLTPDDFCLMSVKGKFERKAGKNVFSGTFDSKSPNKKLSCSSGTIYLAMAADISQLFKKSGDTTVKHALPDSIRKDFSENLKLLSGVDKVETLLPSSLNEFELLTDTVQLDILDDRLEDGDKITIIENKTIVASELEMTNKVRSLKYFIDKKEPLVVFTIIACNEGKSPPNTIKVILRNGVDQELLIARLKKGQMIRLLLRRNVSKE